MKKFRKVKTCDFVKIRARDGSMLDSDQRAEELAKHLESIQWARRPNTIPSQKPAVFNFLDMNCSNFDVAELSLILRKLKKRKAAGDDGIPAEFWQVCLERDILMEWLLNFCNKIWTSEVIPTDWHRAKVACLFKKGDPACPDNYRPISLLQIGYKIFSSMLLYRLKCAGVEQKIWQTQFGFRSGCGTSDAVFICRRLIE